MSDKPTLWARIARVMEESKAIPKNGYNDFHKYHYTMETDLVEGIRPLLVKHGLALTVSTESVTREGDVTTVGCKFTLTDTETGDKSEAMFYGQGQDKADKGIYKAYTGCVKYYLLKTFLIPTGNDPEEDGGKKKQRTQAETRAVQTRQPVTNNASPNWTFFWTEAKKLLPEAKIREIASGLYKCDGAKLAEYITKQSDLNELLAEVKKRAGKLI